MAITNSTINVVQGNQMNNSPAASQPDRQPKIDRTPHLDAPARDDSPPRNRDRDNPGPSRPAPQPVQGATYTFTAPIYGGVVGGRGHRIYMNTSLQSQVVAKTNTLYHELLEAAFVICWPQGHEAKCRKLTSTNTDDFTKLHSQWNSGGCILSVYDSGQADAWIDVHYDHACLANLRKQGFKGPLASMLSSESEALTIFGEMSTALIHQAEELANLSGFPVITRPFSDDPSLHFRAKTVQAGFATRAPQSHGNSGCASSSAYFSESFSTGSQNRGTYKPSRDTGDFDKAAEQNDESDSDDNEDPPPPPPSPGVAPTDSEVTHKADVSLGILMDDNETNEILRIITRVKFYPKPNSDWGVVCANVDESALKAHVSLHARCSSSLKIDFALGSMGFLAHSQTYLGTEYFIPLESTEPDYTYTYTKSNTQSRSRGIQAGLAGGKPTAIAKFSTDQGHSSAVEATANRAAPHWMVKWEHGSDNWDSDISSYRAVRTTIFPGEKPARDNMEVMYGMAVEVEDQKSPPLSFAYVHQIQCWFQVEPKARIRGITLSIAHYIPKARTKKGQRIKESPKLRLVSKNRECEDSGSVNNAEACHDVQGPLAITTAVTPPPSNQWLKNVFKKLRFRGRQQDAKPNSAYFRGWDHTNMRWYHAVWPQWDIDPNFTQGTSKVIGRFDWKPKPSESTTMHSAGPDLKVRTFTRDATNINIGAGKDKGKGKEVQLEE